MVFLNCFNKKSSIYLNEKCFDFYTNETYKTIREDILKGVSFINKESM